MGSQLWRLESGKLRVESAELKVMTGGWRVESDHLDFYIGVWSLESGEWRGKCLECLKWRVQSLTAVQPRWILNMKIIPPITVLGALDISKFIEVLCTFSAVLCWTVHFSAT